jgi:hypothetical protein
MATVPLRILPLMGFTIRLGLASSTNYLKWPQSYAGRSSASALADFGVVRVPVTPVRHRDGNGLGR